MSTLSLDFTRPYRIDNQWHDDSEVVLNNGLALDFVRQLPAGSVQLVLTSPPYNIGKEYEVRTGIQEYLAEQEPLIDELVRILSDTGSICWQVGNYIEDGEVFPLDIYYYSLFKKKGLQLRNRIVWHFGHGLHASKRFSGRYETLLWFSKTPKYTFNLDPVRVPSKYPGKRNYKPGENHGKPSGNPSGKNPSDIWQFMLDEYETGLWDIPNCKAGHVEKTIHPCQFPIELVERCVLAFTNEGDVVLDPYSGVGSTVVGSLKRNRRGIGIEKETNYNDVAKERVQSLAEGKLKTRPVGTQVHVPDPKTKVAQVPQEWLQNKEATN